MYLDSGHQIMLKFWVNYVVMMCLLALREILICSQNISSCLKVQALALHFYVSTRYLH
jgi:hypothetical protein